MKAIVLLLLVGAAAVAVHGQQLKAGEVLPILSSPTALPSAVNVPHPDGHKRRLLALNARAPSRARKLLGASDGTAFTAVYSGTTAKCPSTNPPSAYQQLDNDPGFGELIVNNGICSASGPGQVQTAVSGARTYGGAAQDFGTGYSNWETYGWSLFQVPTLVGAADSGMGIRIDGINLHVIGGVGLGSSATPGCSISAVSVAIFNSGSSGNYDPVATPIFSVKIGLPGSSGTTFTWNTNSSAVLYTDLVDLNGGAGPTALNLTAGSYYWLRVKLFADYKGSSNAGKCFAFWGLQSTAGNGLASSYTAAGNGKGKARWQENAGGALGYSTTCTGAATSPTAMPNAGQTFYNCFNNGAGTTGAYADSTGTRRCLSYRTTVVPALAVGDCAARFNDFNYALFGNTGLAGVSR